MPEEKKPRDVIYIVESGISRLFVKNFSKAGKSKIINTTSITELTH